MAKKLINSQALDNADEIDPVLHDLQIWECVTDIQKKQQGPVIYFALPDKVRSACRGVAVTDLNKDEGLNKLINKLEILYLKKSYITFERFEIVNVRQIWVADCLNKIERLYHEIQRFEVSLPTPVLPYYVLKELKLVK